MIDNLSKSELFTRASLLIKYGFRTTIIALDTAKETSELALPGRLDEGGAP